MPAIESIEEFQEDNEFESQTLHGRRLLNALRLTVSCISCISLSSCFWCSAMIRRSRIPGDRRATVSRKSDSGLKRTKRNSLYIEYQPEETTPINDSLKARIFLDRRNRTSVCRLGSVNWMYTSRWSSSNDERILWPRVAPFPTRPLAPPVVKERRLLAEPREKKKFRTDFTSDPRFTSTRLEDFKE